MTKHSRHYISGGVLKVNSWALDYGRRLGQIPGSKLRRLG